MNFKAGLFTAMGVPISGAVDLTLRVQRDADYWFLDFNDGNFKAAGHVTLDVVLAEPDSVRAAGWYMYNIPGATLAIWNAGVYTIYMHNAGALAPPPWYDIAEIRLPDALGIANILFITTGTALASSPNSIQLAIGESAQDHIFNQNIICITKGLGAGQTRVIMDYAGGTKIAVVNRAWDINPNNTSEYVIIPRADELISNQGIAQAGAASNIQLAATASAIDDFYVGSIVYISSGLGAGQSRIITLYDGGTQWTLVYPAWAIGAVPDNTSVYKVMPIGPSMIDGMDPALQALVVTTLVNAFHDEDLALHLGAAIDNRTIGGLLVQLRLSKYADVEMVRAVAAVPAQGITLPMAASGVIQYEIVRLSFTRNFAFPDFTYYDLWRYDANQIVVEVKASLGIIW